MTEVRRRLPWPRRWPRMPALVAFVLVAGSVTALSAAAPAPRAAPPATMRCTPARLPGLGGGHGNATAVSGTGVAVGIADDRALRSFPVRWRNGTVRRIPTTLQGAVPVGVNRHGVVIGTAFDRASGRPVGWYWRGRHVRLLPTADGDTAFPSAIDDAGHVVGAVMADEDHADGTAVDDVERAAYWPTVHAMPRTLGPLAGDEGAHAFAINGGTVGGVSSGDTFTPVVWDLAGRPRALPTGGGGAGVVHAFTTQGDPAGEAVVSRLGLRAVRWDRARRLHVLPTAGERAESTVTGAAAGLLTGTWRARSAGPGGRQTALLWSGRRSAVLPPVRRLRRGGGPVLRGVGAVARAVTATSRRAVVVGYTTTADGARFPTAWRCEP